MTKSPITTPATTTAGRTRVVDQAAPSRTKKLDPEKVARVLEPLVVTPTRKSK